eukprot:evm.model.scf_2369.1 EVM.evm.TU.scf_2369.1   scf_2369:1627-9703(+)
MSVAVGGCVHNETFDDAEVSVPKEIITHTNFTGEVQGGYDIAMIRLKEPTEKTPISLPPISQNGPRLGVGNILVALGWGLVPDALPPERLQEAGELLFVPNDVCNGFWDDRIDGTMMCAAGTGEFRGQGTCKGHPYSCCHLNRSNSIRLNFSAGCIDHSEHTRPKATAGVQLGVMPFIGIMDGRHYRKRQVAAASSDRITNMLLDAGADIDWQDTEKYTPLMAATYFGNPGVANVLVVRGADVSLGDLGGNTAADIICACLSQNACPNGRCKSGGEEAQIEALFK